MMTGVHPEPVNIRQPDADWLLARRPLVVIVGPTAIGKSHIALHVARSLGTEILTADSTQVYRGMNIGTDKPTSFEQSVIRHRLIDLVDPSEPFNAGAFRTHAMKEIDRLYRQGFLPLMVGGTGLYVRVLIRGMWAGPPVDWTLRNQLDEERQTLGMDHLYRELCEIDPDSARCLHPHDQVKVLRALEVYRQVGVPLSELHRRHGFKEHPFRTLLIGLSMDRSTLYRRIEDRVEVELAKGLVQETQQLLQAGYSRDLTSMKSLGYRQMAGYLMGEYAFEEAVRRLKRDTRHFAKRQMTWFRKEPGIEWVHMDNEESSSSVAERILIRVRQFLHDLDRST